MSGPDPRFREAVIDHLSEINNSLVTIFDNLINLRDRILAAEEKHREQEKEQ